MNKKVTIAMSGGVDSTVAAAILIEQGYEVHGMMMKLWKDIGGTESKNNEAEVTARNMANQMGIPFDVIDLQDLFQKEIVNEFLRSYHNGLTPNPCFECNIKVKWGFLLDQALERGSEKLATGHYARVIYGPDKKFHVHKGVDDLKDQSYVLSGLSQKQLAGALLPLGELTKTEVRSLAKKFGFSIGERSESQDLCFLPHGDYRSFVKRNSNVSAKPGIIRKISGEIVGVHQGLHLFTVGQRKGLGSGLGEPHYVLKLDSQSNEVIIGKENDLGSNWIGVVSVNWILGTPPDFSSDFEVKIRYKSKPVSCKLFIGELNRINIATTQLVRDATPGQIAVIYNGDEVIGSGMILETERK